MAVFAPVSFAYTSMVYHIQVGDIFIPLLLAIPRLVYMHHLPGLPHMDILMAWTLRRIGLGWRFLVCSTK